MSTGNSGKSTSVEPDGAGAGQGQGQADGRDLAELRKQSGRVQFDERGNAVWQWQLKTGRFDKNASTQKLRRLENDRLSLAEDAPTPSDKVKPNPLGMVKGYDPYDSGKLARNDRPKKKPDLRRLGDWLKLKKQVASNQEDEE